MMQKTKKERCSGSTVEVVKLQDNNNKKKDQGKFPEFSQIKCILHKVIPIKYTLSCANYY